MSAAASSLEAALTVADAAPTVRAAATALREAWPGLRVVVVDAFDMRSEPAAATGQRVALWWGTSDGHCWTVTADADEAAAVFIAAVH